MGSPTLEDCCFNDEFGRQMWNPLARKRNYLFLMEEKNTEIPLVNRV